MNRVLREALVASVIWTGGLVRAADAVPFSVRVYNYAEIPEPALAAAQAETARIFRQAGIEMSWLPCAGSDEEFAKSPHKFIACAQAAGAVIVRIQSRSLGGQAMRSHSWLAAAQEQRAEVFYDRLRQFAADQGCKPALILALVMAHELGHLLLGEQSHSSHGIMVPKFRTQELRRAQKGELLFTPDQAQRIRERQTLFLVLGRPRRPQP
jgi:hypothetical protein